MLIILLKIIIYLTVYRIKTYILNNLRLIKANLDIINILVADQYFGIINSYGCIADKAYNSIETDNIKDI